MNIIGRITKDAVVKQLKDERQVVEFSVAVNDYYKAKGAEKATEVTTYFNCAYWVNPKRVEQLKKGALVELDGRVGVNVYNDMKGEAKGSLTFHVNSIKIHQFPKQGAVATVPQPNEITEPVDDLPF